MSKRKLLIMMMSMVVSCGTTQEEIKLYMWTDNIPEDVYTDFEKETGIHVVEDAISSNEEIYAKVKASTANYDIVTPSLDYASIMMKEGLAAKIDKTQTPNLTNIDPNIMKNIYAIDPQGDYIVPFAFGPTVIAYDTTKVTNDIKGFEIFSSSQYRGKMTLLNDMREVMGSALLTLGFAMDTTNATELAEVEKLLRIWKSNILRFDSDSFQIAYANGEIDIVHGYPDTILPNISAEKAQNTKLIIPDKGGIMWIDNLLVLKNAPNKSAAMKFINFIHRPDIYARIMDHVNSLSLNVPARPLMKVKSSIKYADLKRTSMLLEVSDEVLAIQSRVWENVQAQ